MNCLHDKFSTFCAFLDQTGGVNTNCNDRQNQWNDIKIYSEKFLSLMHSIIIYEYLNQTEAVAIFPHSSLQTPHSWNKAVMPQSELQPCSHQDTKQKSQCVCASKKPHKIFLQYLSSEQDNHAQGFV